MGQSADYGQGVPVYSISVIACKHLQASIALRGIVYFLACETACHAGDERYIEVAFEAI